MRILGVGDPFVDLTAHVSNQFLASLNVKPGTRFVIDKDFFTKHTTHLRPLLCRTGGSTANSIISISCLGLPTAFIGTVGKGEYGKFFRAWISELGVEDRCLSAEGDLPTSRCLNMITPDGERTMAVLIGSSKYTPLTCLEEEDFADTSHLLCECYQLYSKDNRQVLAKATELANKTKTVLALGLSDVSCIQNFRSEVEKLVARCNIIFANEFEWCEYYQTTDFKEAVKKAVAYCQTKRDCIFAMTHGEKGAYLAYGAEEALYIPAVLPKGNERNLTGAGDSFAAGFIYAHARGASVKVCGALGAAVASRVISKERATIITQEGAELNKEFMAMMEQDGGQK